MNEVKLRDQRKPGHCWQDNELYDAFGPVIGHHAVSVYTHMTRQCYGTEIRSSSRELARDSGLSKDTVLRSIRAMERIGMLHAVGGGPRAVAEYHLVDLKELAQHHGGTYDRRRVSYVFSAELTASLKALATGPAAVRAGTTGSGGDSSSPSVQKVPVAVSDSTPGASGAVSDSSGPVLAPALALGKPTSGAVEACVSLSASQDSKLQDSPLPPGGGSTDRVSELEAFRVKQVDLARQRGRVPCSDCWEGRCTMNCGPAVPHVARGPDLPVTVRERRRRGPSDGCSNREAMG